MVVRNLLHFAADSCAISFVSSALASMVATGRTAEVAFSHILAFHPDWTYLGIDGVGLSPALAMKKRIFALFASIALSAGAAEFDVKEMFGMGFMDSPEFDYCTATNAVPVRYNRTHFRMTPWRGFEPRVYDAGRLQMYCLGGESKWFDSEEEAVRMYGEAARYLDGCSNLTRRKGLIYRVGQTSRYWMGKDVRTGLAIAVILSVEKGVAKAGGEQFYVRMNAGEVARLFYRHTVSDPEFRPFVEDKDARQYKVVARSLPPTNVNDARRGDYSELNKFARSFLFQNNGLEYVKEESGDERLVGAYLHYSGHDHQLEVLFPRPELGGDRRFFIFTVTDLDYGKPEIGRETNKDVLHKLEEDAKVRRNAFYTNMMTDRSYRGSWGYSCEFNIFVFSFDPSGVGIVSVGLGCGIFDWSADSKGNIICVSKFPGLSREKSVQAVTFNLKFNPQENDMTLVSVEGMGDADGIPSSIADAKSGLPFMTPAYKGIKERVDGIKRAMNP